MSPAKPSPLSLDLDPSHPRLLDGFEAWLHLGLLDDTQVKALARQFLTCAVPQPQSQPHIRFRPTPRPTSSPSRPQKPRWTIAQALKDELSLRWLLWLGVFVVLLSSGMLAASQWGYFPASGQYAVLWGYTLLFGVVSRWAQGQDNLKLTAQTLDSIAWGLVPLNFWAMDEFSLWRSPLGITVLLAASLSLGVGVWRNPRLSRGASVLLLGLSLCHWGLETLPWLALGGIYGLLFIGLWRGRDRNLELAVLAYGFGVLSVRAGMASDFSLTWLGLGWGALGWQLARGQRWRLGAVLLVWGWLVALLPLTWTLTWQSLVVTGFALERLGDRLQRWGKPRDLVLTFAIALQGYSLAGQLLPEEWRQSVTQGLQASLGFNNSTVLNSLWVLPYLAAMLLGLGWLHRRQRSLVLFGDSLLLALGAILALANLDFPSGRSLVWLPLSLLLALVTQHRYRKPVLAYFTQILGLVGFASLLHWQFPDLSWFQWGAIALCVALLEGLYAQLPPRRRGIWQQSAWLASLALAGASYVCWFPRDFSILTLGVACWWGVPLGAMAVQRWGTPVYRPVAGWLSVASTVAVPLLFYPQSEAVAANLGIGAVLMLVQVRSLKHPLVGFVAVGCGVALSGLAMWQIQSLSFDDWLLLGAIAPCALWGLWQWRKRYGGGLSALYLPGCEWWGRGLWLLQVLVLTLHSAFVYRQVFVEPSLKATLAAGLSVAAIALRQFPQLSNLGWYALGWALEVFAVEAVAVASPSLWGLAAVNISLGLAMSVWGDRIPSTTPTSMRSALRTLPVVYGLVAVALRSTIVAPWTGFVTLGFALILLSVGRHQLKPFCWLGLAAVSVSAYELLWVQLGDWTTGDRLVALSALSLALLSLYRGWNRPLSAYLGLPKSQLQTAAHLHWGVGTLLLLSVVDFQVTMPLFAIATGAMLCRYALVQGRHRQVSQVTQAWVYVGVAQGCAILALGVASAGLEAVFVPWYGAIAAVLAYFFRILPWVSWSWSPQPWHRLAGILPLTTAFLTVDEINTVSLLTIAVFYGVLAGLSRSLRWSYGTLLALDWLVWREVSQLFSEARPVLMMFPAVVSLLYIASFDPQFAGGRQRQLRHWLRLLAVGAFLGVAYLEWPWVMVLAMSLATVLAGLGLRVRAFLFLGTAVFAIVLVEQFVILGTMYPLAKWPLGLGLGLGLIWIAATFESRKTQIVAVLQDWLVLLEDWQ